MKTRFQAFVVTLVAISLNQAANASNLPQGFPAQARPTVPVQVPSEVPSQNSSPSDHSSGHTTNHTSDHTPVAGPTGVEQAPPLVDVVPTSTKKSSPSGAAPSVSPETVSARMTSVNNSFADPSDDGAGDAKSLTEAPVIPVRPDVMLGTKVTPTIIKGEFEKVVCISEGTLAVRTSDLKNTVFVAKRGQKTKVFQGWGDVKKKKTVNGRTYTFIKVQIDRAQNSQDRTKDDSSVGWVAETYIKAKTACPLLPKRKTHASMDMVGSDGPDPDVSPSDDGAVKAPVSSPVAGGNSGKGLSDPDCCRFPLATRPTTSFESGNLRFSAGRAKGRKHAACDLYLDKGAPIHAVAGGKVVRGLYYFYQGTYALEVKHDGGFIVRYGEINGKKADNTALGDSIKSGQQVGSMGKVNSNCCEPMLHFELYSGDKTGPLSQGGKGFHRRSDLMNPTNYLLRWEENL